MRTSLVLASAVVAATMSYVFGPDLIEAYHQRESLVADAPAGATDDGAGRLVVSTTTVHSIAARPARPARPAPRPAALGTEASGKDGRLSRTSTKEPVVTKKAEEAKTRAVRPERRRRTAGAERAELESMGLTPAARDLAPETEAPRTALRPRGIVNPMAGRWVDELSGPKARLDMGVKGGSGSCADAYSNCERPAAPKDVSVTGVVVRAERLASSPEHPVAGRVRQGHFLDATPAVYVE